MGQPENTDFNNIYFSSIGLDYAFIPSLHGGVIYDNQGKITSDSVDISESTIYLNWSVKNDFSLNSYVVKGFSLGSPDWATGIQLSISF